MFLAKINVVPSKEWEYDPNYTSSYKHETVAMIFAKNGHLPPK